MARSHDESRLTEPDPSLFSSCGYACMRTLFPPPSCIHSEFFRRPDGPRKKTYVRGEGLVFLIGSSGFRDLWKIPKGSENLIFRF